MARVVLRQIVFGLAATGLLIGCVEGGGQTGPGETAAPAAARKATAAQDVEAPEIYQTTDSALWDGRPSLGGIWVAAPDVTSPERVLLFNPASGKTITGALFKRERENPGPRLQLSSDAAEALGILAGQPTEIRVTALRKAEVEEPAPAETPASAEPGTEPASATGGETEAIAAAALAAVETDAPDTAAAAPTEAVEGEGAVAAAAVAAADGTTAVAPDAAPVKKTWKERRAEAKAAREAKRRAAAEAKAAAAAAAAGTAAVEGEAPTTSPDAAAAALAPIESAPLDARTSEAEAPKRRVVGDAAPAAAATAAATDPEPAPAASGAARPIQVASFSKEENASRAAEALAKIGVSATPQKSERDGKAVWGVVVMGDDAMLKKIRDAGFADAYYLK